MSRCSCWSLHVSLVFLVQIKFQFQVSLFCHNYNVAAGTFLCLIGFSIKKSEMMALGCCLCVQMRNRFLEVSRNRLLRIEFFSVQDPRHLESFLKNKIAHKKPEIDITLLVFENSFQKLPYLNNSRAACDNHKILCLLVSVLNLRRIFASNFCHQIVGWDGSHLC